MSKVPHLHRRGNTLHFRLSVPERLRPVLKVREFNQSLQTENYKEAVPIVYGLAGEAKQFINLLDGFMSDFGDISEDELIEIVRDLEIKDKVQASNDRQTKKYSGLNLKAILTLKKKDIEIEALKERHEKELELERLRVKAILADQIVSNTPTPIPTPSESLKSEKTVKPKSKSKAPLLSVAFDWFANEY